jgi:uncharacterized protein involved in exopolysaccharide biosynthesis
MSGRAVSVQQQHAQPHARIDSVDAGEVSLLAIANVLLRYRSLIIGTAVLLTAVVAVATLLFPRSYTANSTLTPQSRRSGSSLSGLAAQFGLALPTGEGGQSPAFYADLLTSRQILGAVVDTKFEYPSDTGTVRGTLVEIYRSKGATPALRRDGAIRQLAKSVQATTVQKTGVIDVAVTARHPELALLLSKRLIELLNEFNLHTRRTQAGAERRFTEQRLGEVRRDLRAAEDDLQRFLQRNRDYRNSPELNFQQERLQREVLLQQQLFSTLSESYEQAKIEEVRDTPVITVVEAPEAPVRPDPRGLVRNSFLSLLLGTVLGMALAIGRAYARNARSLRGQEVTEFDRLRHEAFQDLIRPWRPLRRAFRRSGRPNERHSDASIVAPEP